MGIPAIEIKPEGGRVADVEGMMRAIAGLEGEAIAAKLRRLMPAIDQKVQEGVSHEAIVETLAKEGLEVSLGTFRKNLYRWRSAQSAKAEAAPPPPPGAGLANGNSPVAPVESIVADPVAPEGGTERAFDPRRYHDVGEQYVGKHKPLFGAAKPRE